MMTTGSVYLNALSSVSNYKIIAGHYLLFLSSSVYIIVFYDSLCQLPLRDQEKLQNMHFLCQPLHIMKSVTIAMASEFDRFLRKSN